MKICFLIQRFDKPSSRYRVLQYLPALNECGIETEVHEVSNKAFERFKILNRAKKNPVVFIQKKLFHSFELHILKSRGARLVYDFDDAIMYRHRPVPGSVSKTRQRQFVNMMKQADAVIAGNRFLKEEAGKYNSNVVLVPTTIDVNRYAVKTNLSNGEKVTLGWLGSPSTLQYLEQILPAIAEVAKKRPNLKLKVVSSVFPEHNGLNIVRKQWSEVEEEGDLHSFDIGLAPLNGDRWCEGKCGLKLLQYMACGLPTVSSPFGGQRDIVEEGKNGLTADKTAQWADKILELIENPGKRFSIGLNARKTVEQNYSLNEAKLKLMKVFSEL